MVCVQIRGVSLSKNTDFHCTLLNRFHDTEENIEIDYTSLLSSVYSHSLEYRKYSGMELEISYVPRYLQDYTFNGTAAAVFCNQSLFAVLSSETVLTTEKAFHEAWHVNSSWNSTHLEHKEQQIVLYSPLLIQIRIHIAIIILNFLDRVNTHQPNIKHFRHKLLLDEKEN